MTKHAMTLAYAREISFSLEAATETFGFLGSKGSGKTFAASKLVELLIRAGVQVSVLDVVGIWFNLRRGPRGGPNGLPVLVFGGRHADVPILPSQGKQVADAIIDLGCSVVIDLSQMKRGERVRFAADYAEQLWLRCKARNPRVFFLMLEEAHTLVPQQKKSGSDAYRCYEELEEIIRIGRNYGVGVGMASQRPESVDKEVLSQVSCLLAFQTGESHARKAIDAWMERQHQQGTPNAVSLQQELPHLPVGEAFLWSPRWLKFFGKVHALPKETFDGGRTPEVGEHRAEVKMARVDVAAVRTRLAETIQEAEREDPVVLRGKLLQLEQENKRLREAPSSPMEFKRPPKAPPIVSPRLERALRRALSRASKNADAIEKIVGKLGHAQHALAQSHQTIVSVMESVGTGLRGIRIPPPDAPTPMPALKAIAAQANPRLPALERTSPSIATTPTATLPKGEREVLTAVAQDEAGADRTQISVLTGFKRSTRDAYLARLRAKNFILDGPVIQPTAAGYAALGADFKPLPTGAALREHWLGRLPEGEKKILAWLLSVFPVGINRDTFDEHFKFARSTRDAYLSRLASKKLVTEPSRGMVRAAEKLFT